jgi:hypothetical protein
VEIEIKVVITGLYADDHRAYLILHMQLCIQNVNIHRGLLLHTCCIVLIVFKFGIALYRLQHEQTD